MTAPRPLDDMLKVGIVGTGTMGTIIGRAVDEGGFKASLVGVTDLHRSKAERFAASLKKPPPVLGLKALVRAADLVVEAAGASALDEILPEVIAGGRDVIVLSVGGLIENENWIRQAERGGTTIYCPSGAIAGLDAVKAACVGTIDEARITTRKPPSGLEGAPYLGEHAIDITRLEGPSVIFEGSAREACRAFPENVNVSAALSLAGIGVDRTRVRLIADPGIAKNIHEIEVTGDFGRIRAVTENTPSDNPKTSRLAALSAVALLETLTRRLRIGT